MIATKFSVYGDWLLVVGFWILVASLPELVDGSGVGFDRLSQRDRFGRDFVTADATAKPRQNWPDLWPLPELVEGSGLSNVIVFTSNGQ